MQQLTPSPELYGKIISRVRYEQQLLKLKRSFFCYSGILTVCAFTLAAAMQSAWRQLNESGFLDLARLASTDFGAVSAHFNDYILSLAESLPLISLGFLALVVMFALISIFKLLNYSLKLKNLNSGGISA